MEHVESGLGRRVVAEGDVTAGSTGFSRGLEDRINPEKDVILRVEAMRQVEHKAIVCVDWIMVVLTVGLGLALILLRIHQVDKGDEGAASHQSIIINVTGGSICVAASTFSVFGFAANMMHCHRSKLAWTKRRFKLAIIVFTAVAAQWFSTLVFLASSVNDYVQYCSFYGTPALILGSLRWMAWGVVMICLLIAAHSAQAWTDRDGNRLPETGLLGIVLRWPITGRVLRRVIRGPDPPNEPNMLILDAGWRMHIYKLIGWFLFEAIAVGQLVVHLASSPIEETRPLEPICRERGWQCSDAAVFQVLRWTDMAFVVVFFVFLLRYLRAGMQDVRRRPYIAYRLGNSLARIMAQTTMGFAAVMGPLIIIFWFLNSLSCLFYVTNWFVLPVQLKLTATVTLLGIFFMPIDPRKGARPVLQEWLQMFAWTEEDVSHCLANRAALPGAYDIQDEPMFCFETAIKLLYWSGLAYEHDEVGRKCVRSMTHALKLYGLQKVEVLRDAGNINKVLVSYGPGLILLSFRGTVNLANVKGDLQDITVKKKKVITFVQRNEADEMAWLVNHPSCRGTRLTRPKVHAGFLVAWTSLRAAVLEKVQELFQVPEVGRNASVIVTGHSLGGAIAVLAAYELASFCNSSRLHVYAFGSPPTSNNAFAREYNPVVPNTWQVATDQDIIARTGKLGCIFHHVGCFAYINHKGDLRVRPSYVDLHLSVFQSRQKVAQHRTEAYRQALVAVLRAQFSARGLAQDIPGVLNLVESPDAQEVLQEADLAAGKAPKLKPTASLLARMRTFTHVPHTLGVNL